MKSANIKDAQWDDHKGSQGQPEPRAVVGGAEEDAVGEGER